MGFSGCSQVNLTPSVNITTETPAPQVSTEEIVCARMMINIHRIMLTISDVDDTTP